MPYLPKEYYTEQREAEKEYENIFSKSWLFACLTTDLSKHNDFITMEVFGRSIVVQNFQGKLAAFQNICAHRFNKIQTEDKGNRPFFCRYHGWTYNSEGKPIGIPQKDTFEVDELECAHLKKYLVDTCGKFVFVKIDVEDQVSLPEFLSDFHKDIFDFSQHFDKELLYEDVHHKANWKLLVENVNEGYHCPMLHVDTLVKSGFCKIRAINTTFKGKHSKWEGPKTTTDANTLDNKKLAFLESRSLKHDSYYHMHLYPSFVFASTEGFLFYIATMLPVNADETILRIRYYSPLLSDNKNPYFQKAFFNANAEVGVKVLVDEDKPVVEQCQKGLKYATGIKGVLSPVEEIRLIKFNEVYLADMSKLKG